MIMYGNNLVILVPDCEQQYQCNDKTCLAEQKWCDNVEDCSNGEDEQNCCKGKGY